MNLKNLVKSLRLAPEVQTDLEKLIQLPEIERVIDAARDRELEQRRKLVAELKGMPKKFAKAIADAGEAAAAANARIDVLRKQLREAEVAAIPLMQQAYGISLKAEGAQSKLEDELRASCDPRIVEFKRLCSFIAMAALERTEYWEEKGDGWHGSYSRTLRTNIDEINAARAALATARNECDALMLQALRHEEMTTALQALAVKITPALATLSLKPPVVEADDIKAPLGLRTVAADNGKVFVATAPY